MTTQYELDVLRSLRRIIRAVDIYSRKLKSEYDLTAPQLICLRVVVDQGPMTATALAEQVYVSPSTIVGILDRLEARGLVERTRNKKDRREIYVATTPAGRKLVDEGPSPLQAGLSAGLGRLPELEQATIALSLQKVVDLMEARDEDAAPMLDADDLTR